MRGTDIRLLAPTGPENLFATDDIADLVAIVKNIRTTALPVEPAVMNSDRIATRAKRKLLEADRWSR
ncbi:hypothetical protein AB0C34_16805 [Nocardia sp. NPDC049220]|uniref:hypothetical protein n=1 Tax=Nocardia sp. NPDC049220 TaxID=3155273 RepID=UPI0033C33411